MFFSQKTAKAPSVLTDQTMMKHLEKRVDHRCCVFASHGRIFPYKKGTIKCSFPFLTMATEDSTEYNLQKYTFDLLLFEVQRLCIASGQYSLTATFFFGMWPEIRASGCSICFSLFLFCSCCHSVCPIFFQFLLYS